MAVAACLSRKALLKHRVRHRPGGASNGSYLVQNFAAKRSIFNSPLIGDRFDCCYACAIVG
jgi:hypothetical protein